MELAFQLLLLSILLGGVWLALQPRYVFLIRIRNGVAVRGHGPVMTAFLAEVTEVCEQRGIRAGWIGGLRVQRRISLRFSRSIPPGAQQQLRNLWVSSG